MPLKAELITKNKSYPCKLCLMDIEKGTQYISVMYSDGFRKKLHGAYHEACWKISPDNSRGKKPVQE